MKTFFLETISLHTSPTKQLIWLVLAFILVPDLSLQAQELEGYQFIQAKHSGKYWSIKNAGTTDKTILWQWDYHGKKQQQFKLEDAGEGYYFIRARHSGKYLSVKNKGMDNGVILWQYEKHGGPQQQFRLDPASDGHFYIQARHSKKYVSVKHAGKENGATIWQWDFHGKAQQQFKLAPVQSGEYLANAEPLEVEEERLPYCAIGRSPTSNETGVNINNKSDWKVRFRYIYNSGSPSDWVYINPKKSNNASASSNYLEGVQIQWLDITTWKNLNGMAYQFKNGTQWDYTVSGQVFPPKPIQIN